MNDTSSKARRLRLPNRLNLVLAPLVLLAAVWVIIGVDGAMASSHREAPLTSADAYIDTTDVYAFVSPDRTDSVTLVGNWIPYEQPEGGPNYYKFGDDVLYALHVDNVGDAKSHLTYEFTFNTAVRNPNTFLYNTGTIKTLTDPNWNVRQFYTVTEVALGSKDAMPTRTVLGSNLPVPPVNIGSKSTPGYDKLASAAIQSLNTSDGPVKVFAGQRDDPFFVDLGSIFDLLSLRGQAAPIGYAARTPGLDGLSGFNVHSIAIQVPISRLTKGGQSVIGVWATSSRQSMRALSPLGGVSTSGEWVQVSRLGMPLTNEAVLPLALKDAFNGLTPDQDYGLFASGTPAGDLLKKSVLDPELGNLLNALYKVPKPAGPRTDLLAIFLTGMKTTKEFTIKTGKGDVKLPPGTNVNQPPNGQPAEMLRLNTDPAFRPGYKGNLCAPTPNYALGLLGGDACGFPNGRRLEDDVTDIELLAVAGAAYPVLTDDNFNFSPSLIGVLSDSVDHNDKPFTTTFPYLASPHQGQEHTHTNLWRVFVSSVLNKFR